MLKSILRNVYTLYTLEDHLHFAFDASSNKSYLTLREITGLSIASCNLGNSKFSQSPHEMKTHRSAL